MTEKGTAFQAEGLVGAKIEDTEGEVTSGKSPPTFITHSSVLGDPGKSYT